MVLAAAQLLSDEVGALVEAARAAQDQARQGIAAATAGAHVAVDQLGALEGHAAAGRALLGAATARDRALLAASVAVWRADGGGRVERDATASAGPHIGLVLPDGPERRARGPIALPEPHPLWAELSRDTLTVRDRLVDALAHEDSLLEQRAVDPPRSAERLDTPRPRPTEGVTDRIRDSED